MLPLTRHITRDREEGGACIITSLSMAIVRLCQLCRTALRLIAPFSAIKEAMTAEASSSGFMKARPADFVGIHYQDDLDLVEMLGYVDELTCPTEPEGEGMVTILPKMIPRDNLPVPRLSDKVLHHMTGLVRGAKHKLKSRIGKWVRIQELIDVLWKTFRVFSHLRVSLALFRTNYYYCYYYYYYCYCYCYCYYYYYY